MDKVMFRKVEELPLVLTPAEISGLLLISKNTAYELLHSKDFPAFRIGKQYRVSRERFVAWLNGEAA